MAILRNKSKPQGRTASRAETYPPNFVKDNNIGGPLFEKLVAVGK